MGLSSIVKAVDNMKSPKTFEELFMEDYRESLINMQQIQENPKETYRPSSLADGCKRMLYYHRMGLGEPKGMTDSNLIEICDNGTDRHERIQHTVQNMVGVEWLDIEKHVEEIRKQGVKTEFIKWNEDKTEARCKNDDLNIYFQCDGLFSYRGKTIILEIKTMNSYTYNKANAPLEKHIRQATCYGVGLNVDTILFLYEDRNFMNKKLFLYELTQEDKDFIRNKIEIVEKAVEDGIPPKKELDKCLYCSKKEFCKNEK